MKINKSPEVFNYLANKIVAKQRMLKNLNEMKFQKGMNFYFNGPLDPLIESEEEFKTQIEKLQREYRDILDHYERIYHEDNFTEPYKNFDPIKFHADSSEWTLKYKDHKEIRDIHQFHKECMEYFKSSKIFAIV